MKGIKRLRQAIKNQRDAGGGEFRLAYHDAEEIAGEIEDELSRLSWAEGVPAPVDADGEVVPLTTGVMYTHSGKRIELDEFDLRHSVLSGGFVWRAIRNTGHCFEDLKLAFLHLNRPDSWERLEEDSKLAPRDYLQGRGMSPDKTERVKAMAIDIVKRAKAIAERDAKEAGRGK